MATGLNILHIRKKQLKKIVIKTNCWVIIALAIFIAATGYATEILKMIIVSDEKDKIQVAFGSETPCMVEITVTANNGEIVYYWQYESAENAVNHQLYTKELGKGTFNVALNYGAEVSTGNFVSIEMRLKLILQFNCWSHFLFQKQ